ncbi:MAG: methyltransferase, partial [Bdellovibrionales bacterium]|nr:methyltransferase [Bdellovibrionales bacterium]
LYPDPLKDFPQAWVDELAQFKNREDVIELEKKEVFPFIKSPSLIAFYRRIEELVSLPRIPEMPSFPENKSLFLHMIPKKQHEIKKLAPYVNAFYQEHKINKVVDIGGGIGHLAQSLANHYQLATTSLDMDPVMQQTGKDRQLNNQVEYIQVKVDASDAKFKQVLSSGCMTLGLHTCGQLANHQIMASCQEKIKGIISFGCCYEKLQHAEAAQNISQAAKDLSSPIHFNYFALTLATRAHRKMHEKDYELKLKVKFYRYAIHILLHDEYDKKELIPLGNSNPKLYDDSFGNYVEEQFRRINLPLKHTKDQLDAYYASSDRQELIWKMLTAGLIRNAFGRVMELYILLDRVLYLEEHGYKVQLLEFFDEPVSPRNIGIVASLV